MAVVKISKRTIEAAIKADATAYLWDSDLKGFGVRISAAGVRDPLARATYLLQYRMEGRASPTKRYTIGRHGSPWTPERARERATDLLEMVRSGIDPIEREREAADQAKRQSATASLLGFSAYADTYLKKRVAGQKRSKEVESIFARDLKPHFGDLLVTDIRKTDVNALLDKVEGRNGSAANKAHKALKTFFAWAVARDTIAASPMAGLPQPAENVGNPRDHTLRDTELRLVWLASHDLAEPFGPLVRLLILTGQRLREVAGMTWLEIDSASRVWTIPKSRTKNELTHLVPLSPLAWEVLQSATKRASKAQLVFTTTGETSVSGFSKTKRHLDGLITKLAEKEAAEAGSATAMTVAPWRYHDLRRTLATGCERLGVPLPVTEAILNHVSGSKRGIVGVYQRHNYADEKRTALIRWAEEVGRITGSLTPAAPSADVIDMQVARTARAAGADG